MNVQSKQVATLLLWALLTVACGSSARGVWPHRADPYGAAASRGCGQDTVVTRALGSGLQLPLEDGAGIPCRPEAVGVASPRGRAVEIEDDVPLPTDGKHQGWRQSALASRP